MSKSINKWLARRPRIYALAAIPLFPILAAWTVAETLWPDVRDLAEDTVDETKTGFLFLIEAYKEWPQNVYGACKEVRDYYEKQDTQA